MIADKDITKKTLELITQDFLDKSKNYLHKKLDKTKYYAKGVLVGSLPLPIREYLLDKLSERDQKQIYDEFIAPYTKQSDTLEEWVELEAGRHNILAETVGTIATTTFLCIHYTNDLMEGILTSIFIVPVAELLKEGYDGARKIREKERGYDITKTIRGSVLTSIPYYAVILPVKATKKIKEKYDGVATQIQEKLNTIKKYWETKQTQAKQIIED